MSYDQRVAKQIAFLKEQGLAIHIPRKGTPYFTKARNTDDTHNRTIFKRPEEAEKERPSED